LYFKKLQGWINIGAGKAEMPVVLIAVLFSNNRNSEGRIKRHCSAIGPMVNVL
jgi:hypothetical protein